MNPLSARASCARREQGGARLPSFASSPRAGVMALRAPTWPTPRGLSALTRPLRAHQGHASCAGRRLGGLTTMELDLIVKGGTVVTGNDIYRADVGVAGGKVVALGIDLGTAARVVSAAGKYVLPGAIDVHTHFEMPFMGTF